MVLVNHMVYNGLKHFGEFFYIVTCSGKTPPEMIRCTLDPFSYETKTEVFNLAPNVSNRLLKERIRDEDPSLHQEAERSPENEVV